jgi:hypothetical protein
MDLLCGIVHTKYSTTVSVTTISVSKVKHKECRVEVPLFPLELQIIIIIIEAEKISFGYTFNASSLAERKYWVTRQGPSYSFSRLSDG